MNVIWSYIHSYMRPFCFSITDVLINDQGQLYPPTVPTAVSIDASNCDTPAFTQGSHNYLTSDIDEASMSTNHGIVSVDDDDKAMKDHTQSQEDTEVDEIEEEEVFQDCEHQHDSVVGFEDKLFGLVSHFPRPEDLDIPPPIPQVQVAAA